MNVIQMMWQPHLHRLTCLKWIGTVEHCQRKWVEEREQSMESIGPGMPGYAIGGVWTSAQHYITWAWVNTETNNLWSMGWVLGEGNGCGIMGKDPKNCVKLKLLLVEIIAGAGLELQNWHLGIVLPFRQDITKGDFNSEKSVPVIK